MNDMRRIVVLGGGESGAGAAVLAKKKGFDVFLSDSSAIKEEYKNLLRSHSIEWEEGHHSEERILRADEIVKSPGIPKEAPIVAKAAAMGISIISEIEFAGRYTQSKMICITGSNGKTTTTSLIYHILKKAKMDVGLAGNIGHSLALQVAEDPHSVYVIELSSFQLDDMFDFRADIAVLMNITPDHLDRYGFCMQNYTNAKMRILQNQRPEDSFIYWDGDPIIRKELQCREVVPTRYAFSETPEDGMAGYIDGDDYVLCRPVPFRMAKDSLALRGKHNIYNQLAAGLAAKIAGVDDQTLAEALGDFPGVEHRLERVATVNGVDYINDSKATNVDACWYALESMTRPTVLIIGGKDKGNDYNAIKELVSTKCVGLVYLGADNTKLHQFFDGLGIPFRDAHSMAECMEACRSLSHPGCTVLLSPCCASFDLFRNMEDRGEQFKQLVRAAAEEEKVKSNNKNDNGHEVWSNIQR